MNRLPFIMLVWIHCLLANAAWAADDQYVFKYESKQVGGTIFDPQTRAPAIITPGLGVSCKAQIRVISDHLAGENMEGWAVMVDLTHPKRPEKYPAASFDLYWNKNDRYPFSRGFNTIYHYLEPGSHIPIRIKASFSTEAQPYLDITEKPMIFPRTVRIFLSDDLQKVIGVAVYTQSPSYSFGFDCINPESNS